MLTARQLRKKVTGLRLEYEKQKMITSKETINSDIMDAVRYDNTFVKFEKYSPRVDEHLINYYTNLGYNVIEYKSYYTIDWKE